MVDLKLLEALRRYPVFTIRQIASIADKDMDYAYVMTYRMKKAGLIREIEKGKYTLEENPFVVASWIIWPSYISSWAALSFYKLTEQLPFTIHVVTTLKRKRKVITFGNSKIEFLTFKKDRFSGFSKRHYQGKEIFVAEKEKAVVDALAARKMSLEEAFYLIRANRKKLSLRRLFYYGKNIRGLNTKLKVMLHDS